MAKFISNRHGGEGLSTGKRGALTAALLCFLLACSASFAASTPKPTKTSALRFSDTLVDGIQCKKITDPITRAPNTKRCFVASTTSFTMTFSINTDQLDPTALLGQVPVFIGNDKWSLSFLANFKNVDKKTKTSTVTHKQTEGCSTSDCPVTVTSIAVLKFSPTGLNVTVTRRAETMAGAYLDEANERTGAIDSEDYVEVAVGDFFQEYFDVAVKGKGKSMDKPITNTADGSDIATLRNVRVTATGKLWVP